MDAEQPFCSSAQLTHSASSSSSTALSVFSVTLKRGNRLLCIMSRSMFDYYSLNLTTVEKTFSILASREGAEAAKHRSSQLIADPRRRRQPASFPGRKDASVGTWPSCERDSEVAVGDEGSAREMVTSCTMLSTISQH